MTAVSLTICQLRQTYLVFFVHRQRLKVPLFKNGKFIHIIRDGRAVIASLVTVRDKLAPWFIDEKNSLQRSDLRHKKLEIAAELWMREVNCVLQDKNSLNPSQYIEMMCGSKYFNHFYGPEKISSVRRKWSEKE